MLEIIFLSFEREYSVKIYQCQFSFWLHLSLLWISDYYFACKSIWSYLHLREWMSTFCLRNLETLGLQIKLSRPLCSRELPTPRGPSAGSSSWVPIFWALLLTSCYAGTRLYSANLVAYQSNQGNASFLLSNYWLYQIPFWCSFDTKFVVWNSELKFGSTFVDSLKAFPDRSHPNRPVKFEIIYTLIH